MKKYGYLKEGVVIALNTEAGYVATDDSVKNLWRIVPDETVVGSQLNGTKWTHPAPVEAPRRKQVSPVEFKMLLTSPERIAIRLKRTAEEPDLVIDDWFGIIDDPRLTMVDLDLPQTKDGLSYLVSVGILTEARKAEIEAGLPA